MLRRLLRLIPARTIEGYQHPDLVDVIVRKTVAYRPEAGCLNIGNARTVLDFGGGAGRHYKEAVDDSHAVRWAIVETPAMVEGATKLSTDKLRFFTNITEATKWLGHVDLMHSNGALQYAPDPVMTLRALCDVGAQQMLWYRLFLSDRAEHVTQISRLADNGPGQLSGIGNKKVSYTFTKIAESEFVASHAGYSLAERGADWFRFVK